MKKLVYFIICTIIGIPLSFAADTSISSSQTINAIPNQEISVSIPCKESDLVFVNVVYPLFQNNRALQYSCQATVDVPAYVRCHSSSIVGGYDYSQVKLTRSTFANNKRTIYFKIDGNPLSLDPDFGELSYNQQIIVFRYNNKEKIYKFDVKVAPHVAAGWEFRYKFFTDNYGRQKVVGFSKAARRIADLQAELQKWAEESPSFGANNKLERRQLPDGKWFSENWK